MTMERKKRLLNTCLFYTIVILAGASNYGIRKISILLITLLFFIFCIYNLKKYAIRRKRQGKKATVLKFSYSAILLLLVATTCFFAPFVIMGKEANIEITKINKISTEVISKKKVVNKNYNSYKIVASGDVKGGNFNLKIFSDDIFSYQVIREYSRVINIMVYVNLKKFICLIAIVSAIAHPLFSDD